MPGYRHVGGGIYEMDNGERVKGKAAAEAAARTGAGEDEEPGHEHRYGRGRDEAGAQVYVCYDRPEFAFQGCGHAIQR